MQLAPALGVEKICLPAYPSPFFEGKIITEVQGVVDNRWDQGARLVAFKITFETGDYLIYQNQGDDAVVLINEPPKNLVGTETSLVTSLG
ncbi:MULTISPECIES: hypothetical protein [Pseudomonas]|uniref:hypothetical protein n=1 Tax=Pseudomonas TaxID=286 RepID=UPI001FF28D7F|nr:MULTISPECIES: hypothetical protein [Pseudomonas]